MGVDQRIIKLKTEMRVIIYLSHKEKTDVQVKKN